MNYFCPFCNTNLVFTVAFVIDPVDILFLHRHIRMALSTFDLLGLAWTGAQATGKL